MVGFSPPVPPAPRTPASKLHLHSSTRLQSDSSYWTVLLLPQPVPLLLHGSVLLGQRRQGVTAGAALAGVSVVTAPVLRTPHLLSELSREHGPAVPRAIVEGSGSAVTHLLRRDH